MRQSFIFAFSTFTTKGMTHFTKLNDEDSDVKLYFPLLSFFTLFYTAEAKKAA